MEREKLIMTQVQNGHHQLMTREETSQESSLASAFQLLGL